MLYKENELPKREEKRRSHKSEPYYSPTHAGGLFAINRKYFLKLGAYDPGLLVWGGKKDSKILQFLIISNIFRRKLRVELQDLAVRWKNHVGSLLTRRSRLSRLHALQFR